MIPLLGFPQSFMGVGQKMWNFTIGQFLNMSPSFDSNQTLGLFVHMIESGYISRIVLIKFI